MPEPTQDKVRHKTAQGCEERHAHSSLGHQSRAYQQGFEFGSSDSEVHLAPHSGRRIHPANPSCVTTTFVPLPSSKNSTITRTATGPKFAA